MNDKSMKTKPHKYLTLSGNYFTNKTNSDMSMELQYVSANSITYTNENSTVLTPKFTGHLLFEGNVKASKIENLSGAFEVNYENIYPFLNIKISE